MVYSNNHKDMCAYCGYQLEKQLEKQPTSCPSCHKKLILHPLKYKRPSPPFYIFLVLNFGLIQLFFIQFIVDIVTEQALAISVTHAAVGLSFSLLIVFIYLRHSWAYPTSIMLLLIAGTVLTWTTVGPRPLIALSSTPIDGLILGFNQLSVSAIYTLQFTAIASALVIGIFFIGADFIRSTVYMVAHINPRFIGQNGSGLHFAARDYAARGLWGTAVLHWHQAIMLDPHRVQYKIALIKAYIKINQLEHATKWYARLEEQHPDTVYLDEIQLPRTTRSLKQR